MTYESANDAAEEAELQQKMSRAVPDQQQGAWNAAAAAYQSTQGRAKSVRLPFGGNIEDDQVRLPEFGNDGGRAVRAGDHGAARV